MHLIFSLLLLPSMALGLTLSGIHQHADKNIPLESIPTTKLVRHQAATTNALSNIYPINLDPIARFPRHADNTPHTHTDVFGVPGVDYGMNKPVRPIKDALSLLYKIPVLVRLIPAVLPHKYQRPKFDHYSDRYEKYDEQLKKEHRIA